MRWREPSSSWSWSCRKDHNTAHGTHTAQPCSEMQSETDLDLLSACIIFFSLKFLLLPFMKYLVFWRLKAFRGSSFCHWWFAAKGEQWSSSCLFWKWESQCIGVVSKDRGLRFIFLPSAFILLFCSVVSWHRWPPLDFCKAFDSNIRFWGAFLLDILCSTGTVLVLISDLVNWF